MMKFLFVLFFFMSLVSAAFWSRSPPHHHEVVVTEGQRVVIEFEKEPHSNTKVFISEHSASRTGETSFAGSEELYGTCKQKLASAYKKTKDVLLEKRGECHEEHDQEHESSGFTGPGELYGTCKCKLASAFKKAKNIGCEETSDFRNWEEHAKDVVDEKVGKFGDPKEFLSEKISDKAKIIGEKAIKVAESAKNMVGKTIGMVGFKSSTEGTLQDSLVKMEDWDLVDSPKRIGEDIKRNASEQIKEGVKETVESVKESSLNDISTKSKALLGFLVSQGKKGILSDKMEMFQGLNLVLALSLTLTNLMFFEPRTTKLIVEQMKIEMKETDQARSITEKLKKLSTYSSRLNVSTMVVLTWHLAYIGQLLQATR